MHHSLRNVYLIPKQLGEYLMRNLTKTVEAADKKKIGILGGTFNPIHNAHLAVAEQVRQQYHLEKVIFLPSGNPPHKDAGEVVDKEHRYAMTLLATNSNPYFYVSRIELEREGPTYTVDTLRQLVMQQSDAYSLYYIIGADTLLDIQTWRNLEEVMQYTEFIVVYRPGIDENKMRAQMQWLSDLYGKQINLAESPCMNISSTDIRQRVGRGQSIRYMVPDEVLNYIKKNKLFQQ